MRGLGIEIAKNIILSGPNRIIIFSPNISKINDLTAYFYLTKDDIENQKRKYEAVLNKLALFYPYIEVNIMKGKNILENINHLLENEKSKYDVVVISEFLSPDEIIKINEICRNNQIGFIYTSQLGIYGICFVDFGVNFAVIDENCSETLKYYNYG